jgi:PAS domain-containing protein
MVEQAADGVYRIEIPIPLADFLGSLTATERQDAALVLPGHGRGFTGGGRRARVALPRRRDRVRAVEPAEERRAVLEILVGALENTGDGAVAVDAAQRIVLWNRAARRLLSATTSSACCASGGRTPGPRRWRSVCATA